MSNLQSVNFDQGAIAQIRQRMTTYKPRRLPIPMLPEAAVLMPITCEKQPQLILTVRSKDMPTHKGEVAFPGGRHEGNESILQTALREAHEEVDLSANQVELLGQLTPLASKHRMKVTPFVGLVKPDVELTGELREIDEIFRVPLAFFLEQKPELTQPFQFLGKHFRLPNYYYDNKRIWGLSALMIIDLLNHVFDADISLK